MRLITWNTNHRRQAADGQARALLERAPDVVALQEVTLGAKPLLTSRLKVGGLTHVAVQVAAIGTMLR